MIKINIESRSVRIPAGSLPSGTYFRYKSDSQNGLCEEQNGILLATDIQSKAVNLYTGNVVRILDLPYEVIKDLEIKGWV